MPSKKPSELQKLRDENERLWGAFDRAEVIYRQVTGNSLKELLALESNPTDAPAQNLSVAEKAVDLPWLLADNQALPNAFEALNSCKAPDLKSSPGNFILGKYPLTDEQQEGVQHASSGVSLKIEAGAGSGKTSSLTAISQHMGNRKGLYLAFNKDIISEAKSRFHRGTECRTTHSVAFQAVGHWYGNRLQNKQLTSQIIIDALGLYDWAGISKWAQANIIRLWVNNFCQGDELGFGKKSVPWKAIGLLTKEGDRRLAYQAAQPIVTFLGPYAIRLWEMLSDTEGSLPIWPDIYLKVWALTEPKLGCDFILLDEAQDTSAVTLKVISNQPCQVIWVGDRRQQIYAWRGAVNAMDSISTERTTLLTRSFRYGQPIAELANKVLENFLGEKSFRIVGSPSVESRICHVQNPSAILCRGNRGAMGELMGAIAEGKKARMASDVTSMISEVEACLALMEGRRPRNPDFQIFNNWSELVEYSESEVGAELQTLVKLIDTWPADQLLTALRTAQKIPREAAELTISTVHRAKGLEFPTVRLADDFAFPGTETENSKIPFSLEEARIFYVGLTRAQYELDVTQCRAAHVALEGKSTKPC